MPDPAMPSAEMVSALIAAAASPKMAPQVEFLRANLRNCFHTVAHGNMSAFGRAAGVHHCTVKSWLTTRLPELPRITKLCREFGLQLSEFIALPLDLADRVQSIRETLRRYQTESAISRHRALDALAAALIDERAPSLKEIARRLGYRGTMQLYRYNSAACKIITSRHKARASAEKAQMRNRHTGRSWKYISTLELRKNLRAALRQIPPLSFEAVAASLKLTRKTLCRREPYLCRSIRKHFQQTRLSSVRGFLQQALKQEKAPTLRELCARLGIDRDTIRKHFPGLCRELLRRLENKRRAERERTRKLLVSALSDEAPPAIEQLEHRAGHHARTLKKWFPMIFHKIVARSARRAQTVKAEKRAIVEAACRESSPPTITTVAGRVGMNRNDLVATFPQLCNKIADRRNRYREKNRRLFKQQVHRAVRTLSRSGRYPSIRLVKSMIQTAPLRDSRLIASEIKGITSDSHNRGFTPTEPLRAGHAPLVRGDR
jgi:hypothetical protein